MSESTLETLLTAEPQALMVVAESGEAELLVASLPAALGVPRDTATLLNFAGWLDAASAQDAQSTPSMPLAERGEPFNLMLRTQRDRYVEVDGRTAGRTIVLKVRDLAGQRLDLADARRQATPARGADRLAARPARRGASIRARPRRAEAEHGNALQELRPARHRLCRVRREPAAHPFQSGLCRALAARPGMARHASARRRDSRPPAPGAAAAREGRLPRLEERAGSPVTAPMRRPRTSGTCPTAARCTSSPTARARRA